MKLLSYFNNILFPARCPVCDEILYDPNKAQRPDICRECNNKIKYITQPSCFKCGKQLDDDEKEYCTDCINKNHYFVRGVAAFSYSDAMKKSMYAFKYNNRREYAGFYAKRIVREYGNVIAGWKPDALIPVPLYKAKKQMRGYNQAEILADSISKLTGIPVVRDLLVRVKNTVPQKELDENTRKNNIKNAFQIRENGLKYNRTVLIDDIYTTGTTVDECAKVLIDFGIGSVYFITACVGRGF